MFVTENQFFVFVACVSLGVSFGMVYSFFSFWVRLCKIRILKIFLDVIYFSIAGILFVYFSYKMNFPNLRMYMILGVLIGIFAYMKSFYIILANFAEKLYNKRKEKVRKNEKGNNRIGI